MRHIVLVACLALLAGCFNGGNTNISLGDVSLGQQLIDLKRALDEGAITEDEYEDAREQLMASMNLCEKMEDDDGWF
jgi:hypothetical protein